MSESKGVFGMLFSWFKNFLGREPVDLLEGVTGGSINTVSYDLPDEYMDFPRYNGKLKRDIWYDDFTYTKSYRGKHYKRASMYFEGDENNIEEYCNQLINEGFVRNSDVRFDRGDTYVIVERFTSRMFKIAFHINMD